MTCRPATLSAMLTVGAALAVAGCGGGGEQAAAPPSSTAPQKRSAAPARAAPSARPASPAPRRCSRDEPVLGGRRAAYAAVARRPTVAFQRPGRGRLAAFDVKNVNGHATVFGVRRAVLDRNCEIAWYRVALPLRPNGSEGYVDADHVRLYRVRTRIVVDLSRRSLTLYQGGRPALRAKVAIGAPSTPTPVGRFYVDQRLVPGDPTGPWGPAAIGISARSEVLVNWVQGGPIAIHGTNDPSSIGRAASHGCVRLSNDVLRRVFDVTEAGTPVIIRA